MPHTVTVKAVDVKAGDTLSGHGGTFPLIVTRVSRVDFTNHVTLWGTLDGEKTQWSVIAWHEITVTR